MARTIEKDQTTELAQAHIATRREMVGLAVAGILGACAFATPALADDDDEDLRRISVSATSTVAAVPDVAEISLTVECAGEDAAETQNDASLTVGAVQAALVEAGIDESCIKVSTMNVSPHYDYGNRGLFGSKTPRITGYTVNVPITVKGVGTDMVGAAIAAAAGAGANSIDGVSYSCSNFDDLYDEALAAACTRAAHKADVAAAALGYSIDGIYSADLGYENQTYRYVNDYDYEEYAVADAAYGAAVAEISFDPGTVDINASVNIDFLARKL